MMLYIMGCCDMKWIKNLESIAITKTSGKCPYCGSDNTDYTFVGNLGEYGYGLYVLAEYQIPSIK